MIAKEAREQAYKVNTSATNSQYAEIKKDIASEASKGKYETHFYKSIIPDVRQKLEYEGYKIKSNSGLNETIVTISW